MTTKEALLEEGRIFSKGNLSSQSKREKADSSSTRILPKKLELCVCCVCVVGGGGRGASRKKALQAEMPIFISSSLFNTCCPHYNHLTCRLSRTCWKTNSSAHQCTVPRTTATAFEVETDSKRRHLSHFPQQRATTDITLYKQHNKNPGVFLRSSKIFNTVCKLLSLW